MPIPIPGPGHADNLLLTAMLTPALFMTANGSLIISTSNRMARIVDRIRTLNELADRLDRGVTDLDYPDLRRDQLAREIRQLEHRSNRIRQALTMLYLAMSMFVGTSLTLAADTLTGSRLVAVPSSLAVVGVSLLLGASVNLTAEALRALQSTRQEVRFYRDLLVRRRDDRIDRGPL